MINKIKKYGVFIILFAVNLMLLFWKPDIAISSFENIGTNLKEMLMVIPPIFILLGLLDVWVEKETMMKYMGTKAGIKGAWIAFLLGSAAAGPLYAAFPIARVMLKKGSSLFNVFIFIGAWSTTKIPMLSFEAANLGLPFTLARLGLSIIGIVFIASVINKALSNKDKDKIYALYQKTKI